MGGSTSILETFLRDAKRRLQTPPGEALESDTGEVVLQCTVPNSPKHAANTHQCEMCALNLKFIGIGGMTCAKTNTKMLVAPFIDLIET